MIIATILTLALVMLILRLSGFVLAGGALPAEIEAVMRFVPVATLAALIVTSFSGGGNAAGPRLIALLIGGVAGWHTRKVWICLVAGLTGYGLLAAAGWH